MATTVSLAGNEESKRNLHQLCYNTVYVMVYVVSLATADVDV